MITPGDGGTGDSSSPSPCHRVNIVVAPLCRQPIDVLPAVLSRGRIIVSILIRFLGTSQTAFFSLHRGFSQYDIDCPPCPTRCPPPCPPVTINLLACFWTRHKKGGQPVLSPRLSPKESSALLLVQFLPIFDYGTLNLFFAFFTSEPKSLSNCPKANNVRNVHRCHLLYRGFG